MTSIAELEAAVQRRPDPETLAVYGDALQAAGDPRGELIAIDLELARLETAPDDDRSALLQDRKRELLASWLGDTIGQQPWHPREFAYGVFRGLGLANTPTESIDDYARRVLDSPLGNRLDWISIYGDRADLVRAVGVLAERGVPWLTTLSLQRVDSDKRTTRKPIDKADWAALVAAAPNLEELTLIGTGIVASPPHPNVHRLRLTSGAGLSISRPSPAVTTLELGFQEPFSYQAVTRARAVPLAGVVNPRAFPGLRTLDLALNEGMRYVDGPTESLAATLGPAIDAIEDLGRLERLRLPSVPDDASARFVIDLAERLPRVSIEIARMFATIEGFAHPRIEVPEPRPWPQSPHGREALTIDVPTQQYGEELALSSLVRDLEEQFDEMKPREKQAWLAFWDFLDDLPWEDDKGHDVTMTFSAATLLRALEAVEGNPRADKVAELIRTAKLPPDAEVSVTRYWGW